MDGWAMQFFLGQGFNTFRIPFLMERVSPPSTGGLTGPFNSTYLDGLKQTVSYITGKGGFAIVDRECLLPTYAIWRVEYCSGVQRTTS